MLSETTTGIFAFILSIVSAVIIFLAKDYKIRNPAFFAYILATASLQTIMLNWQVGLVSLLSGWISALLLFNSERQCILDGGLADDKELLSGFVLRSLVLAIAVLTGYSIGSSNIFRIYGVSPEVAVVGIILGVIGLIQMSMVTNQYKFGHSAIMLLIGFETIFISLEPALAVQFLMVSIKLLTAGSITLMYEPTIADTDRRF